MSHEWEAAEGGKLPLVAELGYYPTGDSWILVDISKTPPIFIHTTDIKYTSFAAFENHTFIVLPIWHSELVPAMKKSLEEGSLGWKKYWQDKLSGE